MRSIIWVAIALVGLGFLASSLPSASSSGSRGPNAPWRRTANGWQRAYWLEDHLPSPPPRLHPLAFGVLLLTTGVIVPVALSRAMKKAPQNGSRSAQQ